jgi:hypothetical protein
VRPEVGSVAELVYESLYPLNVDDETNDWPLLKFINSLTTPSLQTLYDWTSDREDMPGWAMLMNADLAPVQALPWLAQFAGVEFPDTFTEEQQRAAIKHHNGFKRGTISGMVGTAQNLLTGSRSVSTHERDTGSAWHLLMRSRDTETADEQLVRDALEAFKPGGIILDYAAVPGETYADVSAGGRTYEAAETLYGTYYVMETTWP